MSRSDPKTCIFCNSEGPFTTKEHVIPQSLGNDDLVIKGEVCDSCQRYFGKEVEKFILEKTPIAFWRTYLGIHTKKGKNPSVDLSQSKKLRVDYHQDMKNTKILDLHFMIMDQYLLI